MNRRKLDLSHPSQRIGRRIGLWLATIVIFGFLFTAPYWSGKATATETTRADAVVPVSVISVTQCAKIVAVVFAMSDGSLHPVNMAKTSLEAVLKVIDKFPNDQEHRLNADVRCEISTTL